ncbi:MAG: c-type cytochrome [Planctomycetaceae bacterium]|nr:c-type cytochrome [Planctomycetaceae bacterium]
MQGRTFARRRTCAVLTLGVVSWAYVFSTIPISCAADPVADIVSAPLSPAESLKSIVVRPGLMVELVAHEPLVVDPVAIAWDAAGRLWVVEMNDYPLGLDGKGQPGGRVKILTDDDGDGRYDGAKVFLEGLQYPTSVLPWRDGALVCAVPDILFARDTTGDGRADERQTLYTGLLVGNPQHLANGLRYGGDGWVHCANGATKTPVKSVKTGEEIEIGTRDFRIQPDSGAIEPLAGRSQYLRECDDFGNWFGNSNSNPMFHFVLEDRYLRRNPHALYPTVQHDVSIRPGAEQVFPISRTVTRFNDLSRANRFTSACSAMIYRDDFLGAEYAGNSFVCEPVHNLVHREVVARDGATFTSRRPDDEARSEFLASSDNWFRPSMVRTGPDGALWIADMYRLVIEHPEWIPKEWQAKLDLRAGSDKGRIYRVRPANLEPWPIPKLSGLTPEKLAEKLTSGNGTVRDLALQRLVELFGGDEPRSMEKGRVAELLIKQATTGSRPTTRYQCLAALALLDELDTHVLRQALADEDPRVRVGALRWIDGELYALDKQLLPAVAKLADDADGQVRLYAACALGEAKGDAAAEALATSISRAGDDEWALAAVAGSLNNDNCTATALRAARRARDGKQGVLPLLKTLLPTAAALKQSTALDALVQSAAAQTDEAARFRAVAVVLDEFARRQLALASLEKSADAKLRSCAAALRGVLQAARESDLAAENETSAAAFALYGYDSSQREAERARVAGFLGPHASEAKFAATLKVLSRFGDAASADDLLRRWREYSPMRKDLVLDALLARRTWTEKLLDAVAGKQISAAELDITRSQRLLTHAEPAIRDRAKQVLAAAINADRAKVVDQFLAAATLAGDAARGKEAFTKSCANCHKLGELGHAVGPDLAALSDRRPTTLLISVLDPNRAVESKYVAYTAETDEGLAYTGVLVAESTNDVTLALADGKRQTIARANLDTFASTAKSLMPEGMEKDLTPQKLADIFAFLGATQARPKQFAGNEPKVVSPEALRGEFYLLPQDAAIFGPTLVFEPKFSNLGYWRSPDDRAEWELEVAQPGLYDVWIEYARADEAGGAFVLEVAGQRVRSATVATGGWDNYRTFSLGPLPLEAGRRRLILRGDGPIDGALFDLKSIRVKPR